eukprot:1160927-Pelagomonas_calceolata.AAC.5
MASQAPSSSSNPLARWLKPVTPPSASKQAKPGLPGPRHPRRRSQQRFTRFYKLSHQSRSATARLLAARVKDCIIKCQGVFEPAKQKDPLERPPAGPLGVHAAGPLGVHEAEPSGVHAAGPLGVHEAGPLGVHEAEPSGVHAAGPLGVHEAEPSGVHEAGPLGVHEAGPSGVHDTLMIQTSCYEVRVCAVVCACVLCYVLSAHSNVGAYPLPVWLPLLCNSTPEQSSPPVAATVQQHQHQQP